jgi:hypothetical protein
VLAAVAALALPAACATSTTASPPHKKLVDNLPDARSLDGRRAALPDGQYTCTIQESGTKYPSFPCAVVTSNGKVRLEKVAGAPQVHGAITLNDLGFHFEGVLLCPSDACLRPVAADFLLQQDERHYVGEIRTATGVIHFDLRYRPGGAAAYDPHITDEPYEVQPASEHVAKPVKKRVAGPRSPGDFE